MAWQLRLKTEPVIEIEDRAAVMNGETLATGREGELFWLEHPDASISEVLDASLEWVLGRQVAVTAYDGGAYARSSAERKVGREMILLQVLQQYVVVLLQGLLGRERDDNGRNNNNGSVCFLLFLDWGF